MIRSIRAHLAAAVTLLAFHSSTFAASLTIEEQIVGPAWEQGSIFTLSEKGMRFAATHQVEGGWAVTIDGIKGETFDQILMVVPEFETLHIDGLIAEQSVRRQGSVAFSKDGKRHAYAALKGNQVVVILDGKEHFRAPHSLSAPPVSLLQFTPDGKHLFFYNQTADTLRSFRLMMDGKPVTPPFNETPQPHFSADGTRWLLSAAKAKQPAEKILIIDGKDAGYAGERVRFSPDGKHVVCTTGSLGEQKLLLDGKPILTAHMIEKYKIGVANDVATIVQETMKDQFNPTLFLNGKKVPNSAGVKDIFFSPDGKHWAARFLRDMGTVAWVMVDGKKQQDYKTVTAITFSPDSTKCVYVAGNGSRQFVVTNGEEDEGHGAIVAEPTFAETGNKFAYVAGLSTMQMRVFHDGKVSPEYRWVKKVQLSPDGTRCAFYAMNPEAKLEFIVDGEVKGSGEPGAVFFSEDSKHLSAQAVAPGDYSTIYIDGDFLPSRRSLGVPVEFTPDGKHLLVRGTEMDPNGTANMLYHVDGKLVARFSSRRPVWANSPTQNWKGSAPPPIGMNPRPAEPQARDWEFQPDGGIVFLGGEPGPQGFGLMKRIKVTPAAGTTVATWFTDVKAAEEKEAAEAITAQEKAETDKLAAAAAAKAASDDAAAKRKADYDAAVAAKTKARQEAAAAKTRAREEALAAKKAKAAR